MSKASTGAKGPRRKRIPIEHMDRVRTMLTAMVPYSEIIKQCGLGWGKDRRYIQAVIRQIHEDWAEESAQVAPLRRHQLRNGWEALYMMATKKGDLKAAALILRELGHLDGTYAPAQTATTVTHQGGIGVGIALGSLGFKTPEEVRDRVEYLRGVISAGGPQALTTSATVAQENLTTPDHVNGAVPADLTTFIDIPPEPEDGEGGPS